MKKESLMITTALPRGDPPKSYDYLNTLNQQSDGDGLTNQRERTLGTSPLKSDTDGDGYNDKTEVLSKHDPLKK